MNEKKYNKKIARRLEFLKEREAWLDIVRVKEIELLEKEKKLRERENALIPPRRIETFIKTATKYIREGKEKHKSGGWKKIMGDMTQSPVGETMEENSQP